VLSFRKKFIIENKKEREFILKNKIQKGGGTTELQNDWLKFDLENNRPFQQ